MTWNGSQIIYNKVVRPVFLRHEAMVDTMVSDLGGKAMDAAESLTRGGAAAQLHTGTLWLKTSIQSLLIGRCLSLCVFSLDHADEEQSSGDSGAADRSAGR